MSKFNRNIITDKDLDNFREGLVPATFDVAPPAGAAPEAVAAGPGAPPPPTTGAPAPAPATAGAGAPPPSPTTDGSVPTKDDYLTTLIKYVPPEMVGAYLFVAGLIASNMSGQGLQSWLGGLLGATIVLTGVYVWRVLNVVRVSQIAMSMLGIAVYAFALGGWFATTTWYQPFQGSIALVVFAVLVAIARLGPLPAK